MVGSKMYVKIKELKEIGFKRNRVANTLKLDPKTVDKYWNMTDEDYAQYITEKAERTKIMNEYHDFVLERLMNYPEISSSIIFDNLREIFPNQFKGSDRTVRLYVALMREKEGIPKPVTIRQYGENPELPFGYQAQVDMGQKKMKDINGKSVKIYIFAMVLTSSRYKFVLFQRDPFTADTFIRAHDLAFKYFGGRPSEIVYDQDRVMVVSENRGDIIYTETFDNYRNYAGFSVHLCRGADPESKGKIESVVKFVKGNFLSCRVFHGIAALNSDGLGWLDRTGNGKVHETTKMIPSVVFKEEQKHLKAVPEISERVDIPKTAIVKKTNVVMYKQNRYCLPKGTYKPGRRVKIETDEDRQKISFFDTENGSLVEAHHLNDGIGQCVRHSNPNRDRGSNLKAIKEKVFNGFKGDEKAISYAKRIMEIKPRYVRDQFGLIIKLQEDYSNVEMTKGINYCIERSLYSANDLKDTLEYFKKKKPEPVIRSTSIPVKYRVVIAQERSIDSYTKLYGGGKN